MPIYEYECKFCSYKFQLLQKISDPAPPVCPNCNKGGGVHKLISETSFELKGNGWYVTDYKKSSNINKTEKSKGANETKNLEKVNNTKEGKKK